METKLNERLYIRAFEYADLNFLNKLRNDEQGFEYTCGNRYYISSEYDKKWIEDKIFNNKNQLYLAICLKENNLIIGYSSMNDIDHINKKAQYGGMLIDNNYSNKGYATEAGRLMVKHMFEELGMNRLWAYAMESNSSSLKVLEKLGLSKEGLMRDYVFKRNKYHDVFICGLIRKDYQKLQWVQPNEIS